MPREAPVIAIVAIRTLLFPTDDSPIARVCKRSKLAEGPEGLGVGELRPDRDRSTDAIELPQGRPAGEGSHPRQWTGSSLILRVSRNWSSSRRHQPKYRFR